MERLLILEDDLALGEGVRLALQGDDRPVTLCRTLAQARQALEEAGPFALLILDVNLPDGSGLSLLEEVKGRVPVILLTANDLETDIVAGLELGAEDYITKPFSLAVLRARVNAQLRRGKGAGNEVVETGEFVFDFGRMEYRKKGKLVELSKTEQRLLRLLVQNRGTTLSRGDLVDRVWTDGAEYVEENALSVKDAIKTLIGDISHQTKTPIANLLLYAQLLGEQPLPPQGRDCAAALERQAEKLKTLIEALVKTSRLENGILTFQPVVGPLAPMLEQAVAGLQPKADRKGITLTLLPTQAQARFDPKWTEEAVCNLLDNGVKYTPTGGAVTVSVTAYELFCRIDVTDTGMGLAEEEQAKVFQRFYRAPAARDGEGVGIGLYLVRQIAAGQGGYVKVSSQRGRGSTFSLFLPREGAAASERIFRN